MIRVQRTCLRFAEGVRLIRDLRCLLYCGGVSAALAGPALQAVLRDAAAFTASTCNKESALVNPRLLYCSEAVSCTNVVTNVVTSTNVVLTGLLANIKLSPSEDWML